MKILLAIFCILMVLFAGGCALILVTGSGYNGMFQSLPLALIPGGVAALNVLLLMAMFGTKQTHLWAFYVLAVLDAIVVLILFLVWASIGFKDSDVNTLGAGLTAAFAVKAVLTVLTARSLKRRGES